eukprot:1526837-Rhodomonas_salina.5
MPFPLPLLCTLQLPLPFMWESPCPAAPHPPRQRSASHIAHRTSHIAHHTSHITGHSTHRTQQHPAPSTQHTLHPRLVSFLSPSTHHTARREGT